MRNNIIVLLLSILSSNVFGQNIDFNIVVLDTSKHFNSSPYANDRLDDNIVIDCDSIFKETFRWSPLSVDCPKFTEAIWLKRTIKGSCLTKIENAVIIDSTKRTVTWNTIVKSANCKSKDIRHIAIQIPTPPNDFEVLFDTVFLKQEDKSNDIISTNLKKSYFQCIPPSLSQITSLLGSSRVVIDNDSLFNNWKKEGMNCKKPDFSKYLILAGSYGGDCHMRLIPHIFFDPITNTLVLYAYNIWGGCRAGGNKSFVILAERPKEKFSVVFQEIQLESSFEYKQHINQTKDVDNKK